MEEDKILELIAQVNKQMDVITGDTSVPKNVRGAIAEAKQKLNAEGDLTVRISSAIYSVDGVSNDINLPPQARTMVWNLLSMLESIKE